MRSIQLLFILSASVALFFVACKKPAAGDDGCTYSYDPASTEFKWTAYKFTEKAGVGGSFDKIEARGLKSGSPEEVFGGLSFTVKTDSVNSGNETRDPKIRDSFFRTMQPDGDISGSVKSMGDGKAVVNIAFNGQSRDVAMEYGVDEAGVFTASGEIDVNEWGAQESLAALNKVCEDLHKGEDGKSKLWPDVSLSVKSTLKKDCK